MLASRLQPIASTSAVPYSLPSPPKPATARRARSSSSSAPLLVNGVVTPQDQLEKSGGRVKKYQCTHEGCNKSFTRPVRLEEHQRSHTGERPFACPTCPSTFARDSHLKAHLRTHAKEEDKPLQCDECDKKFWTNQHLKKHKEVVHKGKTYDCPTCPSTFRKHHLLRSHIAESHSPPGTNPFICEHEGCDKSFKQMVHLKQHQKVHDPSRYLCHHPSCLTLPLPSRQYPTWSSLQRHTKTAHPPTCPHPECGGRTFTSNRGLKGHLAGHEKEGEGERKRKRAAEGKGKGGKEREGGRKRRRKVKSSTEEEDTAQETDLDLPSASPAFSHASPSDLDPNRDTNEHQQEQEQEEELARDARMALDFAWGGKRKRRIGQQMAAELEMEAEEADGESEGEGEGEGEDEFGPASPWKCEMGRCRRRFKSSDALDTHQLTSHPAPSSFVYVPPANLPPLPPLPSRPAPPFLPTTTAEEEDSFNPYCLSESEAEPFAPPGVSLIDLITGRGYAPTDSEREGGTGVEGRGGGRGGVMTASEGAQGRRRKRRFACPFPAILDIAFVLPPPPSPHSSSTSRKPAADAPGDEEQKAEEECPYRFSRLYDVERHLRARHRVEVERGELEAWLEGEGEGVSGESDEESEEE